MSKKEAKAQIKVLHAKIKMLTAEKAPEPESGEDDSDGEMWMVTMLDQEGEGGRPGSVHDRHSGERQEARRDGPIIYACVRTAVEIQNKRTAAAVDARIDRAGAGFRSEAGGTAVWDQRN